MLLRQNSYWQTRRVGNCCWQSPAGSKILEEAACQRQGLRQQRWYMDQRGSPLLSIVWESRTPVNHTLRRWPVCSKIWPPRQICKFIRGCRNYCERRSAMTKTWSGKTDTMKVIARENGKTSTIWPTEEIWLYKTRISSTTSKRWHRTQTSLATSRNAPQGQTRTSNARWPHRPKPQPPCRYPDPLGLRLSMGRQWLSRRRKQRRRHEHCLNLQRRASLSPQPGVHQKHPPKIRIPTLGPGFTQVWTRKTKNRELKIGAWELASETSVVARRVSSMLVVLRAHLTLMALVVRVPVR